MKTLSGLRWNGRHRDRRRRRPGRWGVAGATAAKKGADVAKAKTLYGLTGKYAGMGYSLGAAHDEAQVRVREYQALHTEVNNRWK
ncbi:hypothetical protein C7B65_26490 [Phormidesmis priestleyi ULC007]|uniref:Uncharacterized protein n=1 Tax=Phormidesmis priestleyi ULC007 TaxID=1920490 RepID=A0A2T1D1M9_9CYAN|nr:hypothetical protein [Phormidesmis priestleyi]PSB14399.1 hypothetical protein C7B65_26490 [Phormidesmis priestleyi ULC007]PZO49389.1 MAG: hypothetical protein DCF14_14695 [Phormidesmis priestleyi]